MASSKKLEVAITEVEARKKKYQSLDESQALGMALPAFSGVKSYFNVCFRSGERYKRHPRGVRDVR